MSTKHKKIKKNNKKLTPISNSFYLIGGIVAIVILLAAVLILNKSTTNNPSTTQTPSTISQQEPTATPSPLPTATPTIALPQIPPMIFNGSAQIKAGELAPAGSLVEAVINDVVCGSTTTYANNKLAPNFRIEIKSASQKIGCGDSQSSITFRINGEKALQNMPFTSGERPNVILNVRY